MKEIRSALDKPRVKSSVRTSADSRRFGIKWKEPKNGREVKEGELRTRPKRSWKEWLNEPVGFKMRQQTQRPEPSSKQSLREWLSQPVGRKEKLEEVTEPTSSKDSFKPRQSWREWLNQPVGAKKPSKITRLSQPRESSRTKQSWKEWLNQPVGGKKPSLRKKKGKKPSVRRKKELSEFSPSPANKFCHECGARILLGSRFCVECGSELGSQTTRAVVGGPAFEKPAF